MSTYHDIQIMFMEYAKRHILDPIKTLDDLFKRKPDTAKLLNKEAFEDRSIDGFNVKDFWQLYRVPYQGGQFELDNPEGKRLEKELIEYSKKLQAMDLTYFVLFVRTDRYVYITTPSFKTENDLLYALVGYLIALEVNMDFTDERFKEISDVMLEDKEYLNLVHGGDYAYASDLPVKKEIEDSDKIRKQINDIFGELLAFQEMESIRGFYLLANVKDKNFTGGMMEKGTYLFNFVELLAYLTHMYPNLSPKKLIDLVTTKNQLKDEGK